MTDNSGFNDGNPDAVPPTPPALPTDPTTMLPVTPAAQGPVGAPGVPVAPGQTEEYLVPDRPWHRQPGPLVGVALGVLVLLGIGVFLFLANGDGSDDVVVTTDDEDSVQLEITRLTRTDEAVSATLTATVTGPAASPTDYEWILPPGARAPEPAVGVTDETGRLKFAWAPVDPLTADTTWSSTVTIDEVLPPNATLAAASFECVLDRNSATSSIIVAANVSAEPVTEQRTVTYSFANTEFVSGDSVSCPILSGDVNVEASTTTLIPETSTTLPPETSTIPTSTVAPTTLPATTVAPVVTTPTTPATAATTVAPKTTVISIIESRTDLSTFSNLINRAGLRDQLAAENAILTIVAPNNAAIEALLATANAPDLNDPATARDFVLAHVKTGVALKRADLAALQVIMFDVGPERAIDATVSPITIGGAKVIEADAAADTGVVHTLDRTLVTPAP